jgi:hypothetical protein
VGEVVKFRPRRKVRPMLKPQTTESIRAKVAAMNWNERHQREMQLERVFYRSGYYRRFTQPQIAEMQIEWAELQAAIARHKRGYKRPA